MPLILVAEMLLGWAMWDNPAGFIDTTDTCIRTRRPDYPYGDAAFSIVSYRVGLLVVANFVSNFGDD